MSDRDAKLNMRVLPAGKQDYDDVGTYHRVSLTLPDEGQITESDCTRISRRRGVGPVVRVDVALAFQGLRDVSDADDIQQLFLSCGLIWHRWATTLYGRPDR